MHEHVAILDFFRAVEADLGTGGLRPLPEYLLRYPEHRHRVRIEYARLVDPEPSDDDVGPPERSRWIGGRYRIVETLGRGGFGDVYLAEDSRVDRRVAVKVLGGLRALSPEWRDRLVREAELTHRIEDDGLCPVFDVGFEGGVPFLVMPAVRGRSLDRLLAEADGSGPIEVVDDEGGTRERDPALRLRDWLRVVERLARTLHATHVAGVVHRDVKPSNVLVRPDGSPLLIDFGLAWFDGADDIESRSGALGTPAYAPPELADGHRVEPRPEHDVWSLGVVLFEGLMRARPFGSAIAAAQGPPPRLSEGHGKDLQAVVDTALAAEPGMRYSTMLEFADDLRSVRLGRPTRARPIGKWRRWLAAVRRRAGAEAVAVGVLGLALGGACYGWASGGTISAADQSTQVRTGSASAPGAKPSVADLAWLGDDMSSDRAIEDRAARFIEDGQKIIRDGEDARGRDLVEMGVRLLRRCRIQSPRGEDRMAHGLILIGDSHDHLDESWVALRHYRQALAIHERLYAMEAANGEVRASRASDVGFGHLRIGYLSWRFGLLEAARDALLESRRWLEEATRMDPRPARVGHEAGAVLELIRVRRALGDEAGARELVECWLPRLRRLANETECDPGLWTRFGSLLSRAIQLGPPADRAARVAELVGAAKRVSTLDRGSVASRLGMVAALRCRAEFARESNQPDSAEADLREALALLVPLSEQGGTWTRHERRAVRGVQVALLRSQGRFEEALAAARVLLRGAEEDLRASSGTAENLAAWVDVWSTAGVAPYADPQWIARRLLAAIRIGVDPEPTLRVLAVTLFGLRVGGRRLLH